jgi:hypothetical protein
MYTYDIPIDDIKIPGIEISKIGPRSEPISIADISRWIADGSAVVNSALAKSGIYPAADMDPTALTRLKGTVIAYVVLEGLGAMNVQGPIYDQAKNKYDNSYAEISNRPQQLGTIGVPATRTNLDTPPAPTSWGFKGFTRNNW